MAAARQSSPEDSHGLGIAMIRSHARSARKLWYRFLTGCVLSFFQTSIVWTEDEPDPPLESFVNEYLANYTGQRDGTLARLCQNEPAKAIPMLRPHLTDSRREIRACVLDILWGLDPQGTVGDIVDALERGDGVIGLVRCVKWSDTSHDLYDRARSALREGAAKGGHGSAMALADIGTPEDLPWLKIGLRIFVMRSPSMPDWLKESQPDWKVVDTAKGPVTGFEKVELQFREAMAQLGDADQIKFFRYRILAEDRKRALDALERAINIRRQELADAAATWLSDEGGPSSCQPSPIQLAVSALKKMYPESEYADEPSNQGWIAYWREWAHKRGFATERGVLRPGPPPVREDFSDIEHLPPPGEQSTKRHGSVTPGNDKIPPAKGPGATPTPSSGNLGESQFWRMTMVGIAAIIAILLVAFRIRRTGH